MEQMLCRICGKGEAVSLGRIPDGVFAGQPVSSPIKGGCCGNAKPAVLWSVTRPSDSERFVQ